MIFIKNCEKWLNINMHRFIVVSCIIYLLLDTLKIRYECTMCQKKCIISFYYIMCHCIKCGWCIPKSKRIFLLAWVFDQKKQKKVWRIAPLCLFWTLWMERNKRWFENVELSSQVIKCCFMASFLEWITLYMKNQSLTMISLINWLCLM